MGVQQSVLTSRWMGVWRCSLHVWAPKGLSVLPEGDQEWTCGFTQHNRPPWGKRADLDPGQEFSTLTSRLRDFRMTQALGHVNSQCETFHIRNLKTKTYLQKTKKKHLNKLNTLNITYLLVFGYVCNEWIWKNKWIFLVMPSIFECSYDKSWMTSSGRTYK